MKKIILIYLVLLSACYGQGTWMPVGPNDFNQASYGHRASYHSVAFDSENHIYSAYKNPAGKIAVHKYNGATWEVVGQYGFSMGEVEAPDITLDGNDVPHVAYVDVVAGNKITVKKFNGTSWINVGTPGISDTAAAMPTIRFDGNNNAYVLYSDLGFANGMPSVKKFNGTTWENVGQPGFNPGRVNRRGLAFDSQNNPYVVLGIGNTNTNFGSVQKFSNNSWAPVGESVENADLLAFAIDNNDMPVVSYSMYNSANAKGIRRYNGTTWQNLISSNVEDTESISIDSNNMIYATFSEGGPGEILHTVTLRQYNGTSWQEIVAGAEFDTMLPYIVLTTDNNNVPYYLNYKYMDYGQVFKAVNNTWQLVGDKAISEELTSLHAIAVGNNNVPYILHNSNNITVHSFTGNNWGNLDPASLTTSYASSANSVAVDSNNVPYAVMLSSGNLVVRKFNGTTWETVGTTILDQAGVASIAISNTNIPYVAYIDLVDSRLHVKKFNGTIWETVGTAVSPELAHDCKVMFDANDVPYVLYRFLENGTLRMGLKKFNGTSWLPIGPAVFPDNHIRGADMAIDSNGIPYIVYTRWEGSGSWTLKVVKFATDWTVVGFEETLTMSSWEPSIVIDSNDTPMILYTIGSYTSTAGELAVAKWFDGIQWLPAGADDFTPAAVTKPAMTIGNNDVVYIVYGYYGAFVKSFDMATLKQEHFIKDGFYAYPNPVKDIVTLTGIENIRSIAVYDLTGKCVLQKENSGNTVNLSQLEKGLYIIKADTGNGTASVKIVKE